MERQTNEMGVDLQQLVETYPWYPCFDDVDPWDLVTDAASRPSSFCRLVIVVVVLCHTLDLKSNQWHGDAHSIARTLTLCQYIKQP